MKSMTGYGRGQASRDGFKISVEISSVNRRQGEFAISLPRELELLEPQIRNEINARIARGRLNVRIALQIADAQWAHRVHLNTPLAKAYTKELRALARQLQIPEAISLEALLRIPGIVQPPEASQDPQTYWPTLETALREALERLLRMREREGAHLARDLKARVTAMRRLVRQVTRHAPTVTQRYRTQLLERIRNAGLDLTSADDDRVMKEVALFADRSDITEELTRLQSHFRQFDEYLKSAEPVGRTLDFLAQEMNREVNTIGSKANDSVLSHAVVQLKAELEKFREQLQNVE